MITAGIFLEKDSLTPAEWEKFQTIAHSEGLSEKDFILKLILNRIRIMDEPPALEIVRRAMQVFQQTRKQ